VDESPSGALVEHVQSLISTFFEVSAEESRRRATGLVLLAEGWGSPELAKNLDWAYRVKKDLGSELNWRSPSVKQQFENEEKQRFESIDKLVPHRVVKPFGV
jgi:hypothetical protein